MSRKVFLSFLGNSIYEETNYIAKDQKEVEVFPTRFIQEALIRNFCKDFHEKDQILIFTTKGALANWEEEKHFNQKNQKIILYSPLRKRLEDLHLNCSIENVQIEDGKSPEELWNIFIKVFNKIREKDEIIFDITHGFRSLPMFNMVLINYAKLLKDISVSGIYYGNYEARYESGDKTFSPIWDLIDFAELQEWANATQLFFRAGYSNSLVNLIKKRGVEGAVSINSFCQEILANRCISINLGASAIAVRNLLNTSSSFTHPVINPIFKFIGSRFQGYKEQDVLNQLLSVDWCIKHKLIQQGYTIMSEFLPSYVLSILGRDVNNKFFRNTVNGFLAIEVKKEKFRFENELSKGQLQNEILDQVLKIPYIRDLAKRNRSINAQNRDDINHGGFRAKPKTYEELNNELEDKFKKLKEVVERIETEIENSPGLVEEIRRIESGKMDFSPMLLNLSNHPSSFWKKNQMDAAKEKYQSVQDLPFPQIPPDTSDEELDKLVDEYFNKIRNINPSAVHLMGELTFTYRLVNRLKEVGIPCIASTTQRMASEDENGKKTSVFSFVRFRPY